MLHVKKTIITAFIWHTFSSRTFYFNAGLPIVHCDASFLLGCVVVKMSLLDGPLNVLGQRSTGEAVRTQNGEFCAYVFVFFISAAYVYYAWRMVDLETEFPLLLLAHVRIMLTLASFDVTVTFRWCLCFVSGKIMQDRTQSATSTPNALNNSKLFY